MKLFAVIHLWDLDGSSHPEAEVAGLFESLASAVNFVEGESGMSWADEMEVTSYDEAERWQIQEVETPV